MDYHSKIVEIHFMVQNNTREITVILGFVKKYTERLAIYVYSTIDFIDVRI